MSYAMTMYLRAKQSESFAHVIPVLERNSTVTDFPIEKPYVSFGIESEEGEFLLGNDTPVVREVMTVTVSVSDESSGEYCRALAKEICMYVVGLDEEKRIISISSGGCRHEPALGAYTIKMSFGINT